MNIKNEISSIISRAVAGAVRDGVFPDELPAVDRKVEYPRDAKFGDYAAPFALESARLLKKSPMEIGSVLVRHMGDEPMIDKVELVKPGFINIYLSGSFLFDTMKEIISRGAEYGREQKKDPRRVNLEFVSANPTGPLNIVSARAAAVGDTIANLLEFSGDTVEREFYVNDYGNQVLLLGRSVLARLRGDA